MRSRYLYMIIIMIFLNVSIVRADDIFHLNVDDYWKYGVENNEKADIDFYVYFRSLTGYVKDRYSYHLDFSQNVTYLYGPVATGEQSDILPYSIDIHGDQYHELQIQRISTGYFRLKDGLKYMPHLESVRIGSTSGSATIKYMEDLPSLKVIIFDGNGTMIQDDAFDNCGSNDIVFYCPENSPPEWFAKGHGYKYITIPVMTDLEKAIFDEDMYAAQNPDLVELLIDDEKTLYAHWLEYGLPNGVCASRVFDPVYYLEHNADLKAAYGDDYVAAYEHFMKFGIDELRNSATVYDPISYRNRYSDLAKFDGESLLKHYVNYGIKEGRNAAKTNAPALHGDADADGEITANDASIMMQKALISTYNTPMELLGKDPVYLDVDGDGEITAADSGQIMQKTLVSTYKMPSER